MRWNDFEFHWLSKRSFNSADFLLSIMGNDWKYFPVLALWGDETGSTSKWRPFLETPFFVQKSGQNQLIDHFIFSEHLQYRNLCDAVISNEKEAVKPSGHTTPRSSGHQIFDEARTIEAYFFIIKIIGLLSKIGMQVIAVQF